MIGFAIVALVIAAVFVFALVLIVGGMLWSGRIALPGSETHRLQQARTTAKVAEIEAATEVLRFNKAQATANRQLLEARTNLDLRELWDADFQRQLDAGDPT